MRILLVQLLLAGLLGLVAAPTARAQSTPTPAPVPATPYRGIRVMLIDSAQDVRGLSLTLGLNEGRVRRGVVLSMFIDAQQLRGLALGLGLVGDSSSGLGLAGAIGSKQLRGVFMGAMFIGEPPPLVMAPAHDTRLGGVGIGALTSLGEVRGLVAGMVNVSQTQRGLAVGLLNHTDQLRGLQLGLLNYAGNNPRALRWLPGINFHL